jgi:HSP20 family protein
MSKIHDLIHWNNPSSIFVRKGDNMGFSLASLQEEMNQLFEHFYTGSPLRFAEWDKKSVTAPAINLIEDGCSFKVEAELAGMDPKNVEVEITGGYLTLKGERKEEKEEKKEGGNYLRQEISYGSFLRTVALPETADGDNAKASFKNGILTVTVPKKAEAQQKPRKIEIKSAA